MQRPNTFPRETSMRESSNNLQELRTRLLARAATTKIFNKIWEEKTLPRLQDTMKKEHDGDYSITIQFDYHENQRIVEVMTEVELSTDIDEKLKSQVSLDFDEPDDVEFDVGLQCIVGSVKRSTGHSATVHHTQEEGWAPLANTTSHSSLKLGDSVGVEDGDSATTLGPGIEFKGKVGFMNRPPFTD
ncbi:zinc finger protein 585a [Colletotrichum sp. SAR11_239]|nr:zinc finger protein 585a [Colletotrichum sp. SAR11_239]KAI8290868.1 zinc finger protein 585a [Colletotrichum sp. SAR 10_98]